MRILGISSTLNKHSFNHGILRNAQNHMLRIPGLSLSVADLGKLPLYNPDCFRSKIPPFHVLEFYEKVIASDAILFASTEYPLSPTFGIGSPLKNALDWCTTARIGPQESFLNLLKGKPAAIIGAGLRYGDGEVGGDSALRQMCQWLEMDLLKAPPIALDLGRHPELFDVDSTDVVDPQMSGLVGKLLTKMGDHVAAQRTPLPRSTARDWAAGVYRGTSRPEEVPTGPPPGVLLQFRRQRAGSCIPERQMSTSATGRAGGPGERTSVGVTAPDAATVPISAVTDAQAEAAFQWYQARIDEQSKQRRGQVPQSQWRQQGGEHVSAYDEFGLYNDQFECESDAGRAKLRSGTILVSSGVYADDGTEGGGRAAPVAYRAALPVENPKARPTARPSRPISDPNSPLPKECGYAHEFYQKTFPPPTRTAPRRPAAGGGTSPSMTAEPATCDRGIDAADPILVPHVEVEGRGEAEEQSKRGRNLPELLIMARRLLYGSDGVHAPTSTDVDRIVDTLGQESAHGRFVADIGAPGAALSPEPIPGWTPSQQYEMRPVACPPEIQRVYSGTAAEEDLGAICELMEQVHSRRDRETAAASQRPDSEGAGSEEQQPGFFVNSCSGGDLAIDGVVDISVHPPLDPQGCTGNSQSDDNKGRDEATGSNVGTAGPAPAVKIPTNRMIPLTQHLGGDGPAGDGAGGPAVHWILTPAETDALVESERHPAAEIDRKTEADGDWGEYAHLLAARSKDERRGDGVGAFSRSKPVLQRFASPTDNVSTWDDAVAMACFAADGDASTNVLDALPMATVDSSNAIPCNVAKATKTSVGAGGDENGYCEA